LYAEADAGCDELATAANRSLTRPPCCTRRRTPGNEEIAETIVEHPKYDEISAELTKHRGAGFQQCGRLNDDNTQFSDELPARQR